MRSLNYQLKLLCRHCREGSFATQTNRERMLTLIANELHDLGYRKMSERSLKPKHIDALVKHWFDQHLSIRQTSLLEATSTTGSRIGVSSPTNRRRNP